MKSEKPIIRFTDILTDSYEFDTFQRQQMFDDSYTLVFFLTCSTRPHQGCPDSHGIFPFGSGSGPSCCGLTGSPALGSLRSPGDSDGTSPTRAESETCPEAPKDGRNDQNYQQSTGFPYGDPQKLDGLQGNIP